MLHVKNLSGDIFGGITAAIVALPLALAFGLQSGMGAIAGLYGAIAVGLLAALFGGTNTQVSGPTGPMTIISSVIIAGQIAIYGSLEAAIGTIVATFVLAGVFLVIMGLSQIGQYIKYMPYPVISGFMSGIGIIIIIMQVFPFVGMNSPSTILDILKSLSTIINEVNIYAILLATATILIIYLFPKVTKKIPSALVALISLTVISSLMNLNVPIIGDIPKGLPDLQLDALLGVDWSHPMIMIVPALTLASLGAIDSLLTAVVADNMTKTQHNSNKELIGQGIGNMFSGIIGGLPGAGATMRTVVNIQAGGTGKLSGIIHSLVLLIILLGAGEYAALIPIPVLAGILITVGIGIIDYKGIKHLTSVPRADAIVMLIVVFLTVFVDLLQAVAMGLVMASLLFMKQMGDISESKSVSSTLLDEFHHIDLKDDEKCIPQDMKHKIYIQHFDGPIFFGFTAHFKKMMEELPDVSIVIFRMHNVPTIDQSGMYAIEDALTALNKKNITLVISEIQEQPKEMLTKIKIIPELVVEENIFSNFSEAIAGLNSCSLNFKDIADKKVNQNILWRY